MHAPTFAPPSDVGPQGPPNPRTSSDATRSGALWIGGTGVALLLAAAAVLTAVRWDDIGQTAKLGGLVAITLGMLWGGQRLRNVVPMTAQAIFHLGALLIPFDVAAVEILAGRSWQETLLAAGLVSAAAWYGMERGVSSVVLRWAGVGAVVAASAGVAAVSPLATPLVLVVAGGLATILQRDREAAAWSIAAGLLPLAALVGWPPRIAGGAIDLGFDLAVRGQLAAASALAICGLVWQVQRTRRLELAWAAVAAATVGVVVLSASIGTVGSAVLAAACVFLGVELIALAGRNDALWKRILEPLAVMVEVGAAFATAALALYCSIDFAYLDASTDSAAVLSTAALLAALGWLTADRRRLLEPVDWLVGVVMGADWWPTTVLFPLALIASVVAASSSTIVLALALLGSALWMVMTGRRGAGAGAALLGFVAVASLESETMWVMGASGGLAAAIVTVAARVSWRSDKAFDAGLLSLGAVVLWVAGTTELIETGPFWGIGIVVAGAWLTAAALELPRTAPVVFDPSSIGRVAALTVTLQAVGLVDDRGALVATCVLAILTAIDAARSPGRVWSALFGAVSVLIAVPALSMLGITTAWAGVALVVAGLVLAGLALAMLEPHGVLMGAAAVTASIIGLAQAWPTPQPLALAVMTISLTVLLAGATIRSLGIAGVGAVAMITGTWLQLALWDVEWLEAYLALPAIVALVGGYEARRRGVSSWGAYVPTIAIVAFVALNDRLLGGSAWHSVIAGAVGVFAVLAGGYARLAGPLVTGTAILGVVAVYESLGPAALVPTWAWLAIGGTVLLLAGVVLERTDTSPLETGRRVRDVIATQFA